MSIDQSRYKYNNNNMCHPYLLSDPLLGSQLMFFLPQHLHRTHISCLSQYTHTYASSKRGLFLILLAKYYYFFVYLTYISSSSSHICIAPSFKPWQENGYSIALQKSIDITHLVIFLSQFIASVFPPQKTSISYKYEMKCALCNKSTDFRRDSNFFPHF